MNINRRLQAVQVANRLPTNNPLRGELLRLAARRSKVALDIGESFENNMFRAHRNMFSILVTDLTNAGKRGKDVVQFALTDLDYVKNRDDSSNVEMNARIKKFIDTLPAQRSFASAMAAAESIADDVPSMGLIAPKFYKEVLRGVDVAPPGFKPFKVEGEFVIVEADYTSFMVRDKTDMDNEPTCIPSTRGGKSDVKAFFRWVRDNVAAIKNMRFHDVLDGMNKNDIKHHTFCAID